MEETIEPVAPLCRRPRNLESVQYLARERRLARQQRALRRAEAREAKKAKATIAAAHKAVAEMGATQTEWQEWADSLDAEDASVPVSEIDVSVSDVAKWKIGQMKEWADSLKTATSGYATAYWTPNVSGGAPGLMNALVKPGSSTVTSAQATGETTSITGIYDPVEWQAADTALSYIEELNTGMQHLKFTSTTNADGSCTVTYEIV